jgi:hypothetical protein
MCVHLRKFKLETLEGKAGSPALNGALPFWRAFGIVWCDLSPLLGLFASNRLPAT